MNGLRIRFVLIFYGAAAGIALFWIWLRGDDAPGVHPNLQVAITDDMLLRSVGLGIATAAAIVIISRLLSAYFEWARNLEYEFQKLLGKLSYVEIIVISFTSGISEELFFRGALQPTIGLGVTTLIFGLLHIGPSLQFLPWTVMALILGGLFGWYYEVTGLLIAPIIAHILINFINLIFIRKAKMIDE